MASKLAKSLFIPFSLRTFSDMVKEAKLNSRLALVVGASGKVQDRLARFGVGDLILTRKEALETALNQLNG